MVKTNKCHLKLQIPMGQRLFFRRNAQNRDYIQTYCNDIRNQFQLHITNGIHKTIQVYYTKTIL